MIDVLKKGKCEPRDVHKGKTAPCKPWRGLEQILPSGSSEGTNPANTLILDFQPPELQDNKFLLFKPPNLWCCVMAILASTYTYVEKYFFF